VSRRKGASVGMDKEALEDLEIVESSGESDDDVIRDVIGEATRAMREQSEVSDDENGSYEADSEDYGTESGNGSSF